MSKHYIVLLMIAAILIISTGCSQTPTPAPATATSVPPPAAPTAVPPSATTAPTTAPTAAPTSAPTAVPGIAAAEVDKMLNDVFNKVDGTVALWNIQPGLGTVMMEYSNRFSRMWFAANAANWDMAKYQLDEMTEIQEVGEVTRPARQTMLKAFEDQYLTSLDKAIAAKDKGAFTTAYNSAINGCNACHAGSSGNAATTGDKWKSYGYVKIHVPAADPAPYIDWKGGGQDSYGQATSPAATAAPKAAPSGSLDAAGVSKYIADKFNSVDRSLALWNIQPGLGTVMIEYADRYSRLYYAAKAGNWDMAKYQLDEMTEIQEVGETTRPNRAPMLKAFENGFLAPLDKAIASKDAGAFDTAFKAATEGCNGCHAASTGSAATPGNVWKSYKYVKIQVPTKDVNSYLVAKADKSTGSYVENPAPAATVTPKAAPTGTLDLIGARQILSDTMNTVNRDLALWNIQPGLGTVMIEYAKRYANLKYALDAGNWDMAKYQLDEMTEIQEVGEVTRPGRAPMLKAFEDSFLKPMNDAILAKDKAKANTAYKNLAGGCNACHTASTSANWKSYGFVQVQAPLSDPAAYVEWNAGAGNTGNYTPASGQSAAPTQGAAGGPPLIPADHLTPPRTACLVCHKDGVNGAPQAPPAIHAAFADDPKICSGCHQQAK